MNQQNMSKTPDLPVKRKRGRPRKDESMPRNEKRHTQTPLTLPAVVPTPPPATVIKTIQPPAPPPATIIPVGNNVSKIDHNMVGQAVTCVIDGIFDNGYLLSTRMGPNNSILRGIVFQQGHVSPVTPENDMAPHVEMSRRAEFPVPSSNPRIQAHFCTPQSVCAKQPVQPMPMQHYQTTPPMVTGGSSSAPHENLRMVEQDDIMQVFEVSKTADKPQDCNQQAKNEHVVSDPMAENLPESDTMIQGVQVQADNLNPEYVKAAPFVEPEALEDAHHTSRGMVQDDGEHQTIHFDPPLPKATEHEPMVNDISPNKQSAQEPDRENPELITPVETVMENQPSMGNKGLQQATEEQTGEESKVDANQDPTPALDVDLSLSSFPEI